MYPRIRAYAVLCSALLFLVGCQTEKSANPLSPSIAGPIAGVVISTPNLLEPGQDWQIHLRDQPVKLLFQNADTTGQRPLTYRIQIAADANFNSIVFERGGIPPGDGPTTSVRLPDALATGRTYWWRVRAEDGANTGEYSKVVAFTTVTPVELGPPAAIEPAGGQKLTTLVPTFKVRAGSKSGPAERILYTVQVANDQAFASVAATFVQDEAGDETTIAQGYSFLERTYYWRVRASDTGDSGAVSAWSSTQTFSIALPPPPAPSPSPGPAPGPGNPCNGSTPLSIVECRRAQYGYMNSSQLVAFLKGVAKDLNAKGISGGPFGILRKGGGHNCDGYSCDIICSGQGTSQKQWDVLSDAEGAQYPAWNGPHTYPNIRVDVCEIQ